jgi:hypothetical protein
MVPKTGSRLPKSIYLVSDEKLKSTISAVLIAELGGSHRATKTVMAWAAVSERTARAWLNGQASPSAIHLIRLSANCTAVAKAVFRLAGYENIAILFELRTVESVLEESLEAVRTLIFQGE